MRLIVLAAYLSSVLALHCPSKCDCGTGDELEYFCRVGPANVTFNGRNNEYVNIKCEGTNFTCEDLPVINFGNELPLPSLAVKGCSPAVLRCVNDALQTPAVNFVILTNGTEPLTEEDVKGLGDVQNLMIIKGAERSIPVTAINSLPLLRSFRISGTPLTLQSDTFANTSESSLEFLELSSGHITAVPEDSFRGLSGLRTLNVWGNNFSDVGVNSLRGLNSLESLSLNTNHLSKMAVGSLGHVPKLKSIMLLSNKLEDLPPGVLHNLTQLENITIQYNKIPLKLHPHSLSNLPSLKNLKIEDCSITLPEDLLTGCDALQILSLSFNKITSLPAGFFKNLTSLKKLDLSHNKIATLDSGVFGPLKKLEHINLNRNYLEVLPDTLFSGLRNLNHVTIDHNHLTTISRTSFQGATGLQTVSLIANKLTLKSPYGYTNFDQYSPFDTLISLKNLYLNGNNIDTIFDDWRMVLVNLEVLNLSWNKFSILVETDCQFLSNHITVDLQHNNITRLALDYASLSPSSPPSSQSNSTILIDNNPLICDCGVFSLAMRLRGAKPLTAEPTFIVDNARCSSPPHLQGNLFKNLALNELNCDLPEENCFDSCSSCLMRPSTNDLAYDCNIIPNSIANPEEFGVKYISMKLKTSPKYIGNLSLQLLNLTNIGLREIPFEPSKTVKTIDLSSNNLTKIPISFLKSNTTLYLSNNPFECQCWYSEEISFLQKSAKVADLGDVTCENGDKLIQVDVSALCSTWKAAAVASGTFISLILILTVIVITIYKYSNEILIFIIENGLFPCCFIEDPDDINKQYDVFISYAHKDRKYITELLPKLENDFGLITCVHYRDWSVGDFIPDQINKSVEKSRRTIILLSNNFLDSAYANMEFRAAHNLAVREGKTRIILILLEDVAKHEKLSDELKAHMKMNTFLKWDDSRFYERLQRALPLKNNKKFVLPDVFKQAGEKTIKSGLDVHLNSAGQLVNIAGKDAV